MVINPALYSRLPYATLKDFHADCAHAMQPLALLVNPNVPAKNLQEFMAYAKSGRADQLWLGRQWRHQPPGARRCFKTATGLFMALHIPTAAACPRSPT